MKKRRNGLKIIYAYINERANTLSIKGILTAILHSKATNLHPVDLLFWCHDNQRNAWLNGKRYAPLIDTIIDEIDGQLSHITLAGPFSKYYGPSCYGNVVMYNRILLWAYIRRLFVHQSLSIKTVKKDAVVKAWKKILQKTRPKLIIGITPSPELCIAAKDMQIWIADMQHGILAPGNFYDLRKRAHIGQMGWPDEILCWDHFSENFVQKNLNPYVYPRLIGHPGFFSKANTTMLDVPKDTKTNTSGINVLVTLTWHLPEEYANDPVFQSIGMPSSLADYIKCSGDFCKWNLRMHPAQAIKRKSKVIKEMETIFCNLSNVSWGQCNEETLHDAFSKSSVHITFDSASAREAAILGINTAILDKNTENATIYFGDLIKENKAEILDPIDHAHFTEWIVKSQIDYETFQLERVNEVIERTRFTKFIEDLKSRITISRSSRDL